MPIVRISLAEGRSQEAKEAMAREITESVARHAAIDASHIYVLFDDVSADDWMVGGETITQRRKARGET